MVASAFPILFSLDDKKLYTVSFQCKNLKAIPNFEYYHTCFFL